ncbi:MAG TPA: tetratricopeptide repeat protein [Terriglobales bacterium]|nr:tetratricopeptide repeat protein [Terriglobales bacterium]
MTTGHFRQTGIYVAACVLAVTAALAPARAQSQESAGAAMVQGTLQGTVQGYVRDSSGRPVANATVFLQLATGTETLATQTRITHTDSEGAYRFAALREGAYTLHAEMNGYGGPIVGPVSLAPKETRKIDLALVSTKASGPQNALPATAATEKPGARAPEFFDEPQFTVAGVTQATNSGGHGSDTVLRTTEALAKATVSLSKESSAGLNPPPAATESSLLEAVAANPKDPELHHLLGDVEEKLGNPLEAVREYQRAAELDPSEPDLFDWGTELLTHRALQPATEVFTKGNRMFPRSVRMLVALGVAWYARGSYDQAAQCLANASDLAPDNPTPYLFLGRLQSVETTPSEGSVERLARFAQLQPDNALANYYYAVGLWKQSAGSVDSERSARVESLLQKAVHLDPKLGAAYLQLGILYSQREDFSRAISAYQKAIEVSPELDVTLEETHYRLAQAYRRTGDRARAHEQLQLHDQLSKKTKEDSERERRQIQEFVISLRGKDSVSQPQP